LASPSRRLKLAGGTPNLKDFLFFQIFSDFSAFCVCTSGLVSVNLAIYIKRLSEIQVPGRQLEKSWGQEQGEMFVFSDIGTRQVS
jgi:hypothetical protein